MAKQNITVELNPFTGELQQLIDDILSGLNTVQTGEFFIVPERRQSITHGNLTLDGTYEIAGDLIIEG